ncbi:MAG: SRPBCC family protein [Actinomycetota bacterium]
MAEYQATFTVDAPPEEVVAYVADLRNLTQWDSSVRGATLASDTGPAVGRTFDVVVGFYGRELEAVYEIVEYDCHSTVAWTIDGKASGTARVEVRGDGDSSAVEYRLELSMKGLAKLLDRGLNVALEGIGENAERGLQRQFRR